MSNLKRQDDRVSTCSSSDLAKALNQNVRVSSMVQMMRMTYCRNQSFYLQVDLSLNLSVDVSFCLMNDSYHCLMDDLNLKVSSKKEKKEKMVQLLVESADENSNNMAEDYDDYLLWISMAMTWAYSLTFVHPTLVAYHNSSF